LTVIVERWNTHTPYLTHTFMANKLKRIGEGEEEDPKLVNR